MSDGPAIPSFGARRAMPADSFLDQVGRVDIDAQMRRLEQDVPDVVREMQRAREQVVKLCGAFLTPELRPVLEWLLDITLRRPMILPNMGPESVSFCALREGQNQIVWQILQAIAEGREERPPPREGL